MEELNVIIIEKPIPATLKGCRKSLKERAAEYRDNLNISEEVDWGEPVGNEVW